MSTSAAVPRRPLARWQKLGLVGVTLLALTAVAALAVAAGAQRSPRAAAAARWATPTHQFEGY